VAQLFPASLLNAGVPALCQQAATPPTISGGHARADGHRTFPLATARGITTLLSGLGEMLWCERARRKMYRHVSSAAWPKLKENLDGLGNAPLKTVIDTHGISTTPTTTPICPLRVHMLAHDNTKPACRASDSGLMGLHFRHPCGCLRSRPLAAARTARNGEL